MALLYLTHIIFASYWGAFMNCIHAVLLAVTLTGMAAAQNTTGTILGTVKDASGAVIPAARIRVTNEATSIAVNVVTNERGDYVVTNLPAASYSVLAESPGFRKAVAEHVTLLLNATQRQDLTLQTGSVDQEVTVTAEAPVISSETSSVASTVDSHAVLNLPLDGRTLDTLLGLTAGNSSDSASNPRLAGSLYWGGNNYSVDGVSFNDTGNGGAAYSYSTRLTTTPSVDTVQEIRVENVNAKAENEGSNAIQMITRAGGNRMRLTLYEYHRDRFLTAKDFFATGLTKPQFNRNEFGLTLNGPIRRNQTFFSVSYEGLRQRSGRPTNLNVPSAAVRTGNFGTANIRDPLADAPFPDSTIPESRFHPRSKTLMGFIAQPNVQSTSFNYLSNVVNRFNVNRGSARVDHKLKELNSFSVNLAYSIGDPYFVSRGTPVTYGNWSDAGYITKSGSLSWTRTFRNSSINEARVSYFSHASVRLGQNLDFDPTTIFPDLFKPLPIGGLPTLSITGYGALPTDYGGSERSPQITIQTTDNYTIIRRSHTLKMGFDLAFQRVATNPSVSNTAFGSFSFNTRYTNNSFGDFLLGYPVSATRSTPTQVNLLHQSRYSAYVQDDWKVSPKLTLNIGLRYMVQTVMQERDGSYSNFDFATGQFIIRTEGGNLPRLAIPRLLTTYPFEGSEKHGWGSNVLNGDHNNWSPRFGFAWRPFKTNRSVVRGAYGIYYSQVPAYIGIRQISLTNNPFQLTEVFDAAAGNVPTLSLSNPFQGSGSVTASPAIVAVNRDLHNGLSQQWNFTVEQQVLKNIGLRLTYLGNKVTRVPWYNYNRNLPFTQQAGTLQTMRPYQPWSDITTLDTNANSLTNQLQVEVNRRMSRGLYLLMNFTWNKSIDNAATVGGPQNPYYAAGDRGNADGVRQHNLNLSGTYMLPFGHGRRYFQTKGFLDALIGGWNFAAISQIRSGLPFTVTYTPSLSGWYSTRADATGISPDIENPGITRWFNPAAFRAPQQFTFGNAGRNILFGPGQWTVNTSLQKEFRLGEVAKMQFRGEAFNMPNHVSFGNPAASLNNANTIGRISGTSVAARAVQFALRVNF
ncbi:MAG: TonB-dependent receptor [Acidobacteria bacterium]|nr:TonB-dependent receptor [Acidobacteriota bacterium]